MYVLLLPCAGVTEDVGGLEPGEFGPTPRRGVR